jgi:hypothetical protein
MAFRSPLCPPSGLPNSFAWLAPAAAPLWPKPGSFNANEFALPGPMRIAGFQAQNRSNPGPFPVEDRNPAAHAKTRAE